MWRWILYLARSGRRDGQHRTYPERRNRAILERQAVVQAAAGVDMVAPSDMMDGRIGRIRAALDATALSTRASWPTRRSSLGVLRPVPRRGGVGQGARRRSKFTYQMDPANSDEALWKSAWTCRKVPNGDGQARHALPGYPEAGEGHVQGAHFVYQVSGEYAMLKAAAGTAGWTSAARCWRR